MEQGGHGPRTDRTVTQGGRSGGGSLAVVNEHCCGWTCRCGRIDRDKDESRRVVKAIVALRWLLEAALA